MVETVNNRGNLPQSKVPVSLLLCRESDFLIFLFICQEDNRRRTCFGKCSFVALRKYLKKIVMRKCVICQPAIYISISILDIDI